MSFQCFFFNADLKNQIKILIYKDFDTLMYLWVYIFWETFSLQMHCLLVQCPDESFFLKKYLPLLLFFRIILTQLLKTWFFFSKWEVLLLSSSIFFQHPAYVQEPNLSNRLLLNSDLQQFYFVLEPWKANKKENKIKIEKSFLTEKVFNMPIKEATNNLTRF